jgi:hypothetical protein
MRNQVAWPQPSPSRQCANCGERVEPSADAPHGWSHAGGRIACKAKDLRSYHEREARRA